MYIVLSFILGGAIVTFVYEKYYEIKDKKIDSLLAPKIERLIEQSSMKIAVKQKELNRILTEDEKDKIFDECYSKM